MTATLCSCFIAFMNGQAFNRPWRFHLKKTSLYSLLILALMLTVSMGAYAVPGPTPDKKKAPELDPSMAVMGLSLLGGTIALARARRKK